MPKPQAPVTSIAMARSAAAPYPARAAGSAASTAASTAATTAASTAATTAATTTCAPKFLTRTWVEAPSHEACFCCDGAILGPLGRAAHGPHDELSDSKEQVVEFLAELRAQSPDRAFRQLTSSATAAAVLTDYVPYLCGAVNNGHTACFQWMWTLFSTWHMTNCLEFKAHDAYLQVEGLVHGVADIIAMRCLLSRGQARDVTEQDARAFVSWFNHPIVRSVIDDIEEQTSVTKDRCLGMWNCRAICVMTDLCLRRAATDPTDP